MRLFVLAAVAAAVVCGGELKAQSSNGTIASEDTADIQTMNAVDTSSGSNSEQAAPTPDGKGGSSAYTTSMPLTMKELQALRKPFVGRPEFRGAWVTRYEWARTDPEKTKQNITEIMQSARQAGLNAIVFQVRGDCTTLYPSTLEPWSRLLGGKDPGFDPVKMAIEEAHKNGLEFHAYFNLCPCTDQEGGPTSPNFVWEKHCQASSQPNWLVYSNGKPAAIKEYAYLNVNLPEVQAYLRKAVMDFVARYDIDGLHFDRVRFPSSDVSDDPWSKARYDGAGNPNKLEWQEWQRDNLTRLLTDIYGEVGAVKPKVKITASVWGIYDNTKLPQGGRTEGYSWTSSGLTNFNQDSIGWTRRGCVDALFPMMYWEMGGEKPDYDELLAWFVDNRANQRHIYGGQKVFNNIEMLRETVAGNLIGAEGLCPFTLQLATRKGMGSFMRESMFTEQVPTPPMPWKEHPTKATVLVRVHDANGNPVSDAHVTLEGRKDVWLTSADGFCAIIDADPAQSCKVTATLAGQNASVASEVVEAVAGKPAHVTLKFSPTGAVESQTSAALTHRSPSLGVLESPTPPATPQAPGEKNSASVSSSAEWKLEASSTLAPEKNSVYVAANLTDGRPDTAWVEGANGAGVGERVTFQLEPGHDPSSVFVFEGIRVMNGLCRDMSTHTKNMRVKSLGVYVDGQLLGKLPLEDTREYQDFVLPQKQTLKPGSKIVFEIQDVYAGTRYQDACISELLPLGHWQKP